MYLYVFPIPAQPVRQLFLDQVKQFNAERVNVLFERVRRVLLFLQMPYSPLLELVGVQFRLEERLSRAHAALVNCWRHRHFGDVVEID